MSMPTCDVCGNPIQDRGETVQLYKARLVSRSVSDRRLNTARISSTYDHFQPVEVTVCPRHRRELFVQRIMPGVITFILLYFPVLFVVSRVIPFGAAGVAQPFLVTAGITLILTLLMIRLISLDGLIAAAMSIREKREKTGYEYLTVKKHRRITRGRAR